MSEEAIDGTAQDPPQRRVLDPAPQSGRVCAPGAHAPAPTPAAAAATENRATTPQWTSSSTISSTRSIGSSCGPAPGWLGWPPRLRPLPLRRCGGLNPGPSLEGGFEELGELRPI